MNIPTKKIDKRAVLPKYAHPYDAGADLYACLEEDETVVRIMPNETKVIPTGIAVAIPKGYEGQVRIRSGLSTYGLMLANGPGTIDHGYTGGIGVILHNGNTGPIFIKHGDRIAQLVISPIINATFMLWEKLEETERGDGGYGSTGI